MWVGIRKVHCVFFHVFQQKPVAVWCFLLLFYLKNHVFGICIGLMQKEHNNAHGISMDASKEEILAAYFQLEKVNINLRSALEDQQVKSMLWVIFRFLIGFNLSG
jgi:hypothetical protein